MTEALTDPKTFLFALIAISFGVTLSLVNQRQIITSSFGFSPLQTTLLSCVDGVVLVVAIITSVQVVSRVPDSISWVGIAAFVPSILGVLLVSLLPWDNKVGLLFAIWLTSTYNIAANMRVHGTLGIRYWWPRLHLGLGLGLTDNRWAYQESYDKRHHIVRILRRKCGRSIDVESTI